MACDYEEKDINLLVKITSFVNEIQSKFEYMFSKIMATIIIKNTRKVDENAKYISRNSQSVRHTSWLCLLIYAPFSPVLIIAPNKEKKLFMFK